MNILVIGADKGLGKVLYQMLINRGHHVAAGFYDLAKANPKDDVLALQMDITKKEDLLSAKVTIERTFGSLDAIVDLAAILLPSDRTETLLEQDIADVRLQIETNALSLLSVFQTFFPIMKKTAKFLAVTSEAGSFANGGTVYPAYSVSKTAANRIVQILRNTVEQDLVTIMAVHPGRMNTEMGKEFAQIEPEDSAKGFCELLENSDSDFGQDVWFINYLGEPMPLAER